MKHSFLVLILVSALSSYAQTQKEVLLIGVFHFNNPGYDVAQVKSFDVMSDKSQEELEQITDKIRKYNPDKIFLEWPYNESRKLDSLYDLYTRGEYFNYVQRKYPKSNFYKQNEIFQLGFRAAHKCRHEHIYALDYTETSFPFDSLLTSMDKANQGSLKKEIEDEIAAYETKENANRQKLTLTQLLLECNEDANRQNDLGSYITLFNPGGSKDNFTGAYLVSEWYRRNLYMYSLMQKITESKDKRVMVIMGSSHVAMFKEFLDLDKKFKAVELKDVLK